MNWKETLILASLLIAILGCGWFFGYTSCVRSHEVNEDNIIVLVEDNTMELRERLWRTDKELATLLDYATGKFCDYRFERFEEDGRFLYFWANAGLKDEFESIDGVSNAVSLNDTYYRVTVDGRYVPAIVESKIREVAIGK